MDKIEAATILDTELNDIMYSLEKAQTLESVLNNRCFEKVEPDHIALITYYDTHATMFHILGDYIIEAKRAVGRLLEPYKEETA